MSMLNVSSLVMSFVYMGSGIFLLIGKNIFQFTDFQRIGLTILLIGYGVYRFFNTIKKHKESYAKENKDENN
jgi:hypothetical protein